MTLQEIKASRDRQLNRIGEQASDIDAGIYDIRVVPVDHFAEFVAICSENLKAVFNDAMILQFPSKRYGTKIICDYDAEFVDIFSEDLKKYLNR